MRLQVHPTSATHITAVVMLATSAMLGMAAVSDARARPVLEATAQAVPTGTQKPDSQAGTTPPQTGVRQLGSTEALPPISLPGTRATAVPQPQEATPERVRQPGAFNWPLSPRPTVLRPFDLPDHEWSKGHRGVDLLTTVGQLVLSAGDGVVAFSGVVAGRGVITVRHSGGLRTTYEPVDDRLASGRLVKRGALIGRISPTPGHCAPLRCLHWGAISEQVYRDPLLLLGFGRPVLLPLD